MKKETTSALLVTAVAVFLSACDDAKKEDTSKVEDKDDTAVSMPATDSPHDDAAAMTHASTDVDASAAVAHKDTGHQEELSTNPDVHHTEDAHHDDVQAIAAAHADETHQNDKDQTKDGDEGKDTHPVDGASPAEEAQTESTH